MKKGKDAAAILCLIASPLLFSFSGVASKWMPWNAYSLTGMRALVAALVMTLARRSTKIRFTKANCVAGVCAMLTSLLFMVANKLTTAANAIVLQYAMPALVILFSAVITRTRPKRGDVAAALCVLAGVVLCFLDSLGGGNLLGDALALSTAFTYAVVYLAARLPGGDPRDYTYLGILLCVPFIAAMPFDPGVQAGGALPYAVAAGMGVLLSAGYLCFNKGIAGASPVTASILSNLEPVFNPLWVFLALGERPGLWAILGAAVVITSVTVYSVRAASAAGQPENI